MIRTTWRVLAFGALLAGHALPASAQVVIGGSNKPDVEVNWGVLDQLGAPPTLADLLKKDGPAQRSQAAQPAAPQGKGLQYQPYKPGAGKQAQKPVAQKQKAVAAKKPKAEPAIAKHEAPKPAAIHAPEPLKGPQVALPEVPKPAKAPESPKAPEIAKVEPPKPAPAPKPEPVKLPEPPKVEAPKPEPLKAPEPVKLPDPPKPAAVPAPEPAKPMQIAKVAEPVPAPVTAPVSAPVTAKVKEEAPLPLSGITPPPLLKSDGPKAETAKAEVPKFQPPSAGALPKGDATTIVFAGDSALLPDSANAELQKLAKRLGKDDSLGLQLLAYAEGDEAGASKARRLSLSRALEVRKFLMELGVRSTRIEVRALGNKSEGGPADRVDAVVVGR